jgi:hypothetical protein
LKISTTSTKEKKVMKNSNVFSSVLAIVASAILVSPSITLAGVAEASALVPISIPAKNASSVAGVKFVGIPVARPSVYEGLITTAVSSSSSATVDGIVYTTLPDSGMTAGVIAALNIPTVSTAGITNSDFATADNQYVLEITSGANIGLTRTISAINAGGPTVVGSVLLPLAVGTKYVIRPDWTLGTLLGKTATEIAASGVTGSVVLSSADNIGIIRNGVLVLYYWTGSAWKPTRNTVTGVDYSHVRLPLSGGIYYKRNKTTATTVYLSGVYRATRLQALLEGADNAVFAVTTPNFSDTTLAQTGLHRYVKSSSVISSCDEVRVVSPTGAVESYINAGTGTAYTGGFWNGSSASAPSWKSTRSGVAGSANNTIIPAGSAIMFKKETASPRQIGLDAVYSQ